MSKCKLPNCNRAVGTVDGQTYRDSTFCSPECDVTYDKRKQDAKDAARARREEAIND